MSRLKDEIIEDTSKLGEIIEYCKLEIEAYNKYWKGNEAMLFYYLKKGYDLSKKKYNMSK